MFAIEILRYLLKGGADNITDEPVQ